MKKIWTLLMGLGLVLINSTLAVADEPESVYEPEGKFENQLVAESITVQKKPIEDASQLRYRYEQTDNSKYGIKFRGIWGFNDDKENDGYVGGALVLRGRLGIMKGGWNFTDNESKGHVFGLMKHGFINGRVITPKGSKCLLTGFYRINKENGTLKIRWMTPNKSGWAICKLHPSQPLEDIRK